MKLHLPKMLAVALLSAYAAITANADVPYTGSVYTWDNTTSGSDPAFGNYALTTYDEQGNPTVTSTVISGRSGNWGNVQAIFASDAIQTGNTLRFDSEHGQSVKTLSYTFTPFTVGGIIVEEGATGFSIQSGGANNRAFFLGNKNGSASYNEIHEDFAINKTTGGLNLTLRGAETFYVAEGKTFTLKSNNPIAMSGSMNVTGEGTVDIAQGNVTMANGFSLTVQEGATLKFAGAVSGLSTTINNNGAITFNGVALSDSLAGFEVSGSYVDYSGAPSANGNGYAGALDYTIIKGNTDALTQVTWKGETKTLDEGVMHVEADVDYTTYHLNTDGTSLDLATERTNNDRLSAVTLATGTKLIANDSFDGTVSGAGTATVELAAGKALTGAVTGVALTGSGTYELASGTGAVGTGVTFASGWTGTVKLSNITTTELDLNNFGITGSVVEIDNWSRYLKNSNGYVYNPKLRLSGGGMTVSDGYSNYSYVFAGGVEGTGDFKIGITTSANNQTYVFTGDVSQWTGAYESLKNKNTTIQFSGLALEMGAAIKQTDGTINIVVGDGESDFSTTFDKTVTASTLTINEKASAKMTDETSIGTLSGAGFLTVDADSHTVALGGGAIGDAIDLLNGTLSLSGAYTLDALDVQDYTENYVGPESFTATGSGFRETSGTVQLVNFGSGTLSIADDATFTYEGASVAVDDQTGKGTLGGVDLTTLWVNGVGTVSYNAAQEYAEQQVPETVVETVHLNVDGATVDMDRAGASVALVLSETAVNATVNATQATTISGISGWADTLTVSGTEAVTMPAGTMTLTGTQQLVVEGTVNTNKIQLDSDDAVLTVAEGATLNVTGNNNLTPNKGTVNISGTVNVGHELDLSNGQNASGQVNIASTGKLSAWGMWMHNGVSVNLEEGGEFAIGRNEVKDLSIIGKDGGSITFTPATGDATYGTNNANFTITNATVTTTGANVTLGNTLENVDVVIADGSSALLNTTASSVTVNEGGTLLINKEMDLGGTLTSNGNITVATAGVVTISGDSTFVNVITNSGTVHLNGITLDTEYFQQQGGDTDAHFNLNDELTTDDNYFVGTSEAFVQVVSGGTSDTTGITWDGDTYDTLTNGKIVTGEADVDHTTFYVGGEISTSAINASEHVAAIENINVGDGATLTVDAVSEAAIHAQDGATVAGDKAQQSVEIAADATVTYAYGISSTEGVYVFGLDGVSVTNKGGSDAIYGGLGNATMAVEADALSSSVNEQFVVNNQLSVSTVTHQGEGELTLANVNGDALSVVETDTADLILQGITATTLSELTIGGGATVGVYTDTTKATEGTVTIDAAGVLTAGDSTLRANLEMADDSVLLVGGVQKALHVGSLLTMGSNISLDTSTLQALDGLADNTCFWLIDAAEDSELLYGGSTGEDAWFDEVFSRTAYDGDYELKGDFNIVFDDVNGFGLQKFSSVPEPTTGTLSLLALMALAARRRKH
ncbi:MAG: hypothetical protein MJ058_08125 [Akkermansia sp.]|nr:hypothetical protein [Akkermansia sp.]